MPAFEYDSNGLPSDIERVCVTPNLGAHVEEERLAGRTRALGGRIRK